MQEMNEKAEEVAGFLKGMANRDRLLILCQLSEGEKTVTELIEATGIAQTSMSQHLSKLKSESIVDFRREHRLLFYYIANEVAHQVMAVLYDAFCKEGSDK